MLPILDDAREFMLRRKRITAPVELWLCPTWFVKYDLIETNTQIAMALDFDRLGNASASLAAQRGSDILR